VKRLTSLCAAGAIAGGALLLGQQIPQPRKQFGASVTAAFEGWFDDKDAGQRFLVGYFNRNTQEELDIPIGPNNDIEPGGPDMGQPTHFLPGRQWGMFVVPVPRNFRPQDKLTWTLIANGQINSIPLRLNPDYNISPFSEIAVGNTPPMIRFEENGAPIQGPIATLANAPSRTASLSDPLALTLWLTDDMKFTSGTGQPLAGSPPPVALTWSKYRGPGKVTFDLARPNVEKLPAADDKWPFSGKATTNVKFSEAGDYVLHVTANDYSGVGGSVFQCCWTTGLLKVSVR